MVHFTFLLLLYAAQPSLIRQLERLVRPPRRSSDARIAFNGCGVHWEMGSSFPDAQYTDIYLVDVA